MLCGVGSQQTFTISGLLRPTLAPWASAQWGFIWSPFCLLAVEFTMVSVALEAYMPKGTVRESAPSRCSIYSTSCKLVVAECTVENACRPMTISYWPVGTAESEMVPPFAYWPVARLGLELHLR